jgi:queuine tRNA-ribosyltransferase
MPVGTQGTVKTLGSEDLEGLGFELVLANTYHLSLRPGSGVVRGLGGLHHFMGWRGGILTDSGGFQVMSLAQMAKVDDAGVAFKSHLDGSSLKLTPELAIQIQADLGVDVAMALDQCPPYPASRDTVAEAMGRTHRWAPRCLSARRENQAVFGIVQGGVHEDLRAESASVLTEMDFQGFAIGGVSVGEPTDLQYPVVKFTAPLLPRDKPRYLMGVGRPRDIIHAVSCGIDLFDCVLPTRMARHHALYTLGGRVNVMSSVWETVDGPVDPGSVFPQTERYPAAYLRHLFKCGEPLGARLATLHNLAFYARLMSEIRDAIETQTWGALVERYAEA